MKGIKMKPYKYKNRYGDIFTFTPTEDGNLLWEGNFEYCRYGFKEDPNKITMVDPSGGPYIAVNMKSELVHPEVKDKVVSKFENIETGYKVILEDKK